MSNAEQEEGCAFMFQKDPSEETIQALTRVGIKAEEGIFRSSHDQDFTAALLGNAGAPEVKTWLTPLKTAEEPKVDFQWAVIFKLTALPDERQREALEDRGFEQEGSSWLSRHDRETTETHLLEMFNKNQFRLVPAADIGEAKPQTRIRGPMDRIWHEADNGVDQIRAGVTRTLRERGVFR